MLWAPPQFGYRHHHTKREERTWALHYLVHRNAVPQHSEGSVFGCSERMVWLVCDALSWRLTGSSVRRCLTTTRYPKTGAESKIEVALHWASRHVVPPLDHCSNRFPLLLAVQGPWHVASKTTMVCSNSNCPSPPRHGGFSWTKVSNFTRCNRPQPHFWLLLGSAAWLWARRTLIPVSFLKSWSKEA